jgi:anti-sigma-K factor RskA
VSGCPHRDDAGPWVLGALDEDDARAFASHLEGCAACRDEVAALQPVVDVLPMAAPQEVPPPELKSRIMAVVESEAALLAAAGPEADRPGRAAARDRDRTRDRDPARGARWGWLGRLRPVPAAVLATALIALGVAAGVLVDGSGDDVRTLTGFGPKGAQVALRVDGHHGRLELHGMPKAPAGHVYQVWLVTGKDKPRATHALFSVAGDGETTVDIPESLKGADQVLVTAEPPTGSPQPTSDPVAGASLA